MKELLRKLKLRTGIGPGIPVEVLKSRYTTPESRFLNVQGMDVHYRVTGDGPALLLIHGIGSCLHTWSKWHDILSEDFTVISLDLPGFGLTGPHPSGDFSIQMYMKVFDHLLDHLGVKKACVAGNSLGGLMTWNYASRRPARVRRIALLNAAGFNVRKRDVSDVAFLMSIHPATRRVTHYFTPASMVRQSLENCVTDTALITDEKVRLYHEHILREGNRESFSRVLEGLIVNQRDNLPDIAAIQAPTLILWGDEDALINVNDAFRFHQAIRNSELIIYENIGHLPMLEIPEKSAADVRAFFRKKIAAPKQKEKA